MAVIMHEAILKENSCLEITACKFQCLVLLHLPDVKSDNYQSRKKLQRKSSNSLSSDDFRYNIMHFLHGFIEKNSSQNIIIEKSKEL